VLSEEAAAPNAAPVLPQAARLTQSAAAVRDVIIFLQFITFPRFFLTNHLYNAAPAAESKFIR
jgi:hypothetical protein